MYTFAVVMILKVRVIISDEAGQTIITHPLCRQRGKLICISHPERAAYTKHKQLYDEVLNLFGDLEPA